MNRIKSSIRKKGVLRVFFYAVIPHCHFQPPCDFNGLRAENYALRLKTGVFTHGGNVFIHLKAAPRNFAKIIGVIRANF